MQSQAEQQITGTNGRQPEVIRPCAETGRPGINAVLFQIQKDRHPPEALTQVPHLGGLISSQNSRQRLLTHLHRAGGHTGTEPINCAVARCRQPWSQSHR